MEIRCLIRSDGNIYVAMSLDFGLAAQAESIAAAKGKLEAQIEEYIREACEQDSAYKSKLLARKGPFSWFIIYYLAKLHIKSREILAFTERKPTCIGHA
ncbi:DUF1902 domain-containing protein [Candidatus Venteria ishoeyi]|uniref:DUF1902 domain-containing protein n=1 Tax=Candidatus Venteria ishoeyi TaxID=1899563 RepID=A0A1H6F8V9_9GAMM|nr:DUF1902 domain-containing protein [Candidatus Venteria ishoeyi]MDM8547181.1 hypothetical protein [Candidatus Venteria ishoeyi]SEH06552.1 Uncharacterised protein [Candidatus Venteria ishoeyi]